MHKKFKSGVSNKLFRALNYSIFLIYLLYYVTVTGWAMLKNSLQDTCVNLRGTDFIHPLKITLGSVSEKSSAKMSLKGEDASKKSSSIITLKMPLGLIFIFKMQ